ncbi:class 1b ribonucleoside-diphosphate reductase subunit alpha [Spiroplasma platyhelix]|uniref:Protein NrdI n=1 Tax=Spiroplasma platyhelix PALS-1 TaxID=1276218 RepID=A0A846U1T2_9MOLU|nr:class 1b ribonucleoside-diphosphate reductase subunit alpha [Spiroplasma platyhelix]MBE4704099.1 Ribonucleoside-diphosphate reductase subunit alpha 1 [Spiroplasma platyhelix PALS-1]NKE38469.1 class 1b ribonucleoside-diphosphate reductase subunit alpha [Spiroplasma platyhelix PALS-1]UJB29357.1 ribonucleotide-diphosphate reductase subunit alpha [Spiroplasma platyhelix PALS-1]
MHNDVIKVTNEKIVKPQGKIYIVYFSSTSNNTHRFIQKLEVKNSRIPYDIKEEILVDQEYVLITPTYSGGGEFKSGAVPKQVINFLNKKQNRDLCRGIMASGNTNFGNTFAMAGPILSKKLNVPLLYQFELLGTKNDVETIKNILVDFWIKPENKKISTLSGNFESDEYITLNAKTKLFDWDKDNFKLDFAAAKSYLKNHIIPNSKKFNSTKERIEYLVKNKYYDEKIINKYSIAKIENLTNQAYSYNHYFPTFVSALKFFNAYALKSFDGKEYLENYEDRVIMNALFFGDGKISKAKKILNEIMLGRFQPATPTFLNAGKKQRGEYVSCYLLRIEDNMESIARGISTSLQLSKSGGGVALCLTNLRECGAPIKNIANQATGVIPVMKILEDSFSYANQLGQRQGAGAVYLNAHHPDIMSFLDTKRENADEKIRIKSLSLGIVIPNITFELAKDNKDMALFSPYDIKKVYKKSMTDISVTQEYYKMLNNPKIKKTFISARKLFQTIAELHFESGYPYLLFDDTVNNRNAHPGRIVMSNLCSEIIQVSTASKYNNDLSFKHIGQDISCNLGSVNIAKMMESGSEFSQSIEEAIYALDHVSRNSNLSTAPSIKEGNKNNHALGLGAMNLHGFLATNHIFYNSKEAVDFTNIFFYTMAYHAFKASNKLAEHFGSFVEFKNSKFADGSYFDKYTQCDKEKWKPATKKIKELFDKYQIEIPTQNDWKKLVTKIKTIGIANSHLMAVAPTGSISYLSACTPSLQPIVSPVEVRKEGKLGRVYVPAYKINVDNLPYYLSGAYEIGPNPIIDIAAAAQQHVDQAISLTLFMTDKTTTRDLNKAYIKAFKQGCSSIYYVRVRQEVLENSENYQCDACVI